MRQIAGMLVLGALLWTLAGCGGEGGGSGATDDAAPGAGSLDAAATQLLAAADGLDGSEDHVVSKCLMCGFAMSGDAAHASTVGDYTVHLCSENCQVNFDSDPVRHVRAAELP